MKNSEIEVTHSPFIIEICTGLEKNQVIKKKSRSKLRSVLERLPSSNCDLPSALPHSAMNFGFNSGTAPKSVFLRVSFLRHHKIEGNEHSLMKIARAVLTEFYRIMGSFAVVETAVLLAFVEDVLEETPPGDLVFPYSELEGWHQRYSYSAHNSYSRESC